MVMHKIHLEENAKPSREPQRRLNPAMQEVVRAEVIKLLDARIIYPISNNKWVSPIHVVPKRAELTVVKNKDDELVPTRIQSGWRVGIDYRKLNATTRKDHFPLPFIDKMVERLAGHDYYCFLDGYSGYNQVLVDPEEQEKNDACPLGCAMHPLLFRHRQERDPSNAPILQVCPAEYDVPELLVGQVGCLPQLMADGLGLELLRPPIF
jgi:hypothetical protein